MKRRKMNIPASVSVAPIRDNAARNCWSKPKIVDHPPGRTGARPRYRAKYKYQNCRTHQDVARIRLKLACQSPHQKQYDRHGNREDNFFPAGNAA